MRPPDDLREQLYNDKAVGLAKEIQVPQERITRLHGILIDLDPGLLQPDNPVFRPAATAAGFHANIRPVLDRHPLARHAEVRASGTGLHVIIWLRPAVELTSAADQQRWAAMVRAVQCTLPSDPDAPGITALTRPIGSTNSKNGATVELIREGESIEPAAVETYVAQLADKTFRAVASPLLGEARVSPCPVCAGTGTHLAVVDHVGLCYGCGNVTLDRLFDCIFASPGQGGGADGPAVPC
jgi:hypothetical protein